VLRKEITKILSASRDQGWVLEPEAKRIFSLIGLEVPRFIWTTKVEEALRFAKEMGYPVVGKIVSPKVLHKSDRNGVVVGIKDDRELAETFERFSRIEGFAGILVEEMVSGLELIVGSKVDYQFGPVILLGMGGTGVEIYRDISLRMAPLSQRDIENMINCLKAHRLLEGYRGRAPIDRVKLVELLKTFSDLVMEMENRVESIDLNPVMCSPERSVIADARIILKKWNNEKSE
jgi:acetate---CoA ligase (ADP-forming) subunit beta